MIFRLLLLVVLLGFVKSDNVCGAGRYCSGENDGDNICTLCPGGYYCPGQTALFGIWMDCSGSGDGGDNNAPAYSCPAGKYSSTGASSCTSCAAGKFSGTYRASSSSTCTSCPAGLTSYSGSTFCMALTHKWDFRGCTTGVSISDSSPNR